MNLCQTQITVSGAALLCLLGVFPCSANKTKEGKDLPPNVALIGRIAHPRITESSGIAASRQYPDVFWTHTDGGGPKKEVLYAISRDGKSIGEFALSGAMLIDWEDIAVDDKHIYIGDLGNNEAKRTELAVHQVAEPDPKSDQRIVRVAKSWRLRFPGEPFDCESLFVWQGNGFVVSKVSKDARAQVFRFPMSGDAKEPITLELVATTRIESPVTGADLSPNGKLLGLVAKSGAFVYQVDGDLTRAGQGKPFQVKFRHDSIEGCTFVPEGLLATAESREIYLFTDPAFQWK